MGDMVKSIFYDKPLCDTEGNKLCNLMDTARAYRVFAPYETASNSTR